MIRAGVAEVYQNMITKGTTTVSLEIKEVKILDRLDEINRCHETCKDTFSKLVAKQFMMKEGKAKL